MLGRLRWLLIERYECSGYVPNTVYSCGCLIHGRTLLLPYPVPDEFPRFAIVPIDELIGAMA